MNKLDFDYSSSLNNDSISDSSYQFDTEENIVQGAVRALITSFIGILAVTGNLGVIVLYFLDDLLRNQTGNVPIVFLAMTDMITGLFIIIPSAVSIIANQWIYGDILCQISTSIFVSVIFLTCEYLALISMERFTSIRYPFVYQAKVTSKTLSVICTALLLHSLSLGFIYGTSGWSKYIHEDGTCNIDVTEMKGIFSLCLGIYTGVIGFVLPTCIIATCNVLIVIEAYHNRRRTRVYFIQNTANNLQENNKKTVKTMIVLVSTFEICMFPMFFVKQTTFYLHKVWPTWIHHIANYFYFTSSFVNPFIYAIFRKDFQNGFKKLPRLIKEKLY